MKEMLGALIIQDQVVPAAEHGAASTLGVRRASWAGVEILGKAPIARIAEDLKSVCDSVSVVAENTPDSDPTTQGQVSLPDPAAVHLANYKREGFGAVLIVRCGAYVEVDVREMSAFHRKQDSGVTRAFSDDEPLDVWMVAPSAIPEHTALLSALLCMHSAVYVSEGYANRLRSPRDLRRLVLDSFHARCRLRPQGSEIRPGVWVGEGAQIDRCTRVVAPAFIGRNVRISDECLITRGSNIESNSRIDFGTAVEDSSILSNTYVGIGLDLAYSIVQGRNLVNLRHNVMLEITDPAVMRENAGNGRDHKLWAGVENGQMAPSSCE
jgi:NDP-sugar pyrophosphorylase family protein